MSGIGTDLQATTRANDCLTAPNASSPRGQHWYYHMDLPNNRKCRYLHAPLMHRAARRPNPTQYLPQPTLRYRESCRQRSALTARPNTSVKPQPTSFVSAKSIQRGDPTWVPQENVPQGNAPNRSMHPNRPMPSRRPHPHRFHNKTIRKEARYRSMDLNRPIASRRPRPQPQNLSSRVTRLRFHNKTIRKEARYRSMDLNRPIPSRRPRPQPQNLSIRVTRLRFHNKTMDLKRLMPTWRLRPQLRRSG